MFDPNILGEYFARILVRILLVVFILGALTAAGILYLIDVYR